MYDIARQPQNAPGGVTTTIQPITPPLREQLHVQTPTVSAG
jgi:hypothetical protein